MLAGLTRPAAVGFLITASLALALAQSIFEVPIQVSDSLEPIVVATRAESASGLFVQTLHTSASTLRPMRYVQARWLVTLAERIGVSYNTVFRGAHAALIVALLFVFTGALPVSKWIDVAALGIALTVLIGLHTFSGMVLEAYPVNHYAVVAFSALAVFAMARRQHRMSTDLAVGLLLTFCLLLIESGALVWLVVVVCALAGLPGIKRSTVILTTAILLVYAGARHELGIGMTTIGSHGSGYWDTFYSAEELEAKFGSHPLPFLAYNAIGGVLSVLFSEPRYGVYQVLDAAKRETLSPVVIINIVSSALLTLVIGWQMVQSFRRRRRDWSTGDRTLLIAAVVLAANAAMCGPYMKDEILSVAGVFYALAAFVAVQALLQHAMTRAFSRHALALVILVIAASAPLWAFRAAGVHYQLRLAAYNERNEWTWVLRPENRTDWPSDARQLVLTRRLKDEALQRRVASPHFLPRWGGPYWVE
jgi:hypothetical protein